MAAAPSYLGLGITTAWHLSALSRRGDYSVLTSKEVCLTWVWRCAGRASPWSSLAVLISPPQTPSAFCCNTSIAAGNTDTCNHGSARSNVHTDKHWCTLSCTEAHQQTHIQKHTHNIEAALFSSSDISRICSAEWVSISLSPSSSSC